MYKICGIALRGRGHIKHNMPCQDKIAYFQSGNLNIIALSDGAGSAKYSHFGAEKSVKFVCEEFSKNFDGYFNQQDGNVVKSAILSKVRSRMIDLSNEHDCEISDLAHTLLFVAIKDNNFILFHIGDGIIGCVKNGQIKVASLPTNGEFANVTVFATSDDALQNAKIIKGKIDQIEGFVLMSDGSSESFYDKQSKNLTKILLKLINFKLRAATGCKLFTVYAALLIVDVAADIVYGMLQVLAPPLITPSVVKYMALANLLFEPLAPAVLLLAWPSMKSSASSQDLWH